MENNVLINQIGQTLAPLKQICDLQNTLPQYYKSRDAEINRHKSIKSIWWKLIITGLVLLFPAIIPSFFIGGLIAYPNEQLFIKSVVFSYPFVFLFLFGIIFIIILITRKSNLNKSQIRINSINYNIASAENQLSDTIKNSWQTLSVLPRDYCYFFAANYIYNVLINRRADSLKEAINLYEEQLHRWKMEQYSADLLEQSRQQQMTLNAIKRYEVANIAASVLF